MSESNIAILKRVRGKLIFSALFFLVFFLSSFDVALNLRIKNYSIRSIYVAIFIALFLFFFKTRRSFSFKFLAYKPFVFWFANLTIFLFTTPLVYRSIGYHVWLSIHAFFIIALSDLVSSHAKFVLLIRLYILSFLCIAIFGILQFIMGALGFSILIEQWWVEGRFPRVNAFSYEPSYFATYLFIGISFLFYLIILKEWIFRPLRMRLMFGIMFLGLILSSSRMGLMFAVLLFLSVPAFKLIDAALKAKLDYRSFKIGFWVFVLFTVGFIVLLLSSDLRFLLAGTGIMGTSSHSNQARVDQMINLWEVFKDNPFKGYSLGGVTQALALKAGVSNINSSIIKDYEGINIFLEVLVASGIIGFTGFLVYIIQLIVKPISLAIKAGKRHKATSNIVLALGFSLIFELALLALNQNILRAYLWNHIAVLNCAYFILYQQYKHVPTAN